MSTWLQVLLQILEAALQALLAKQSVEMGQTDTEYATDIAKLKSAIAVLKA